jgi:mRNA interferase MazF
MNASRGDIVLVSFPYASGGGAKRRPALVVQSDHNNARLSNTIIVQIASNISRVDREATQVLVDPSTADGQSAGLLSPSAVTCENITSVANVRVTRKVGSLSPSLLQQVNEALKASLDIS